MKLTARQLKQIIQEELQGALNEAPTSAVMLTDVERWREEIMEMHQLISDSNVETPEPGGEGRGPKYEFRKGIMKHLDAADSELYKVALKLKPDEPDEPVIGESFRVGDETFKGLEDAKAKADDIARRSGYESDVHVMDGEQIVYTAGKGAKGQMLEERVNGLLTDEEILAGLKSDGREGWWTIEKIRDKLLPIEDSRSHGWRENMRTAMDGLGMRRTYR